MLADVTKDANDHENGHSDTEATEKYIFKGCAVPLWLRDYLQAPNFGLEPPRTAAPGT